MQVPFFRPTIGKAEIDAVTAVLRSGWLTTGQKCFEFEQRFSQLMGTGVHAVAVNSATAGLHLAAEACGLTAGDEVLVPTLTFTATAEVFRYLGARVVLVDVEPRSLTIDLADAARKCSSRCRAIVPVHFGGWPCDLAAIIAFARQRNLKVIEDAAHALPAHRDGRIVGSWETDACVFSFYANKTMTTGEGGMLTTRDAGIAKRARTMRTHGLDRDSFDRFSRVGSSWSYDVVAPGFKYNLTDLAAAIGLAQLERIYEFQASRHCAAMRYIRKLQDLPVDLPEPAPPGGLHAWHLFPIRVRSEAPIGRDQLISRLAENGIGSSVHYRPLHKMSYWRHTCDGPSQSFPVADHYFEAALTLPLYPAMRASEIDAVELVIRDALS